MNDLQRLALMGDRQAQKQCAEKGIVLPCPWCKKIPTEEDVIPDYAGWIIYHDCKIAGHMRIKAKTRHDLILRWNTRPAPPVGRCKDCRYFGGVYDGQGSCSCGKIEVQDGAGVYPFENDYCSYFEEKEDTEQ